MPVAYWHTHARGLSCRKGGWFAPCFRCAGRMVGHKGGRSHLLVDAIPTQGRPELLGVLVSLRASELDLPTHSRAPFSVNSRNHKKQESQHHSTVQCGGAVGPFTLRLNQVGRSLARSQATPSARVRLASPWAISTESLG